jgi:hypothetical protein
LSTSSMATFSQCDTHFGQTEADPTSINIRDETGDMPGARLAQLCDKSVSTKSAHTQG